MSHRLNCVALILLAVKVSGGEPVFADDIACGSNHTGQTVTMNNRTYLCTGPDRCKTPPIGFIILDPNKSCRFNTSRSLIGMSIAEAEVLFGHVEPADKTKIFQLWGVSAADKSQKSIYKMETKFADGKLIAYRLSGLGIKELRWITD